MARKTVPDLQELFRQAAEIAKQVPESMQHAAFNRALDMLVGDAPERAEGQRSRTRSPNGPPKRRPDRSNGADQQTSAGALADAMDSTQHPGVTSGAKILDRSLMILQIAHDDHGIDGLSPGEIAKILTDKFRIGTSSAAVRIALGRATNLVNRVSKAEGFQYRIMAPGEEYLAHRNEAKAELPSQKRSFKKTTKPKRKSNPKKGAAKRAAAGSLKLKSKSSKKSAVSSSRRPGPGAMLRELVSAGFFSKAKTIREIQEHAEHNLAHTYELNELSTPLRRAIHNKLLVRTKNSDGQYEYTEA